MLSPGAVITGLSAPWLLVTAVGVALVIALHLIDPRRAPRVIYPAAAILRLHDGTSASPRLRAARGWLLILTRALILALALLAFDRPTWSRPTETVTGTRNVIVLDRSASMGMPAGVVTRLDRARELVRSRLDDLDLTQTPAALLLAGERTVEATAGFVRDAAPMHSALNGAEVLPETADLDRAIRRARRLLGDGGGAIHVVTDGQHLPTTRSEGVVVHTIDTSTPVPNAGVVDLAWAPVSPVAGEGVVVTARVLWTGNHAQRTTLEIALGDDVQRVPVSLTPGETVEVSATYRAPNVDRRTTLSLGARVDPDVFPADDERAARLLVRRAIEVCVVGEAPYFTRALAPTGTRSPFEVRTALTPDTVLEADLVVCAPRGDLSLAYEDALGEAQRRGTPVLWLVRDSGGVDALEADSGVFVMTRPPPASTDGPSATTLSAFGTERLPALASSGLLDDLRAAPEWAIDASDGSMRPLITFAGTPVCVVGDRTGVLTLNTSSEAMRSSPALVLLAHELCALLDRQRPRPAQPDALPARESEPITSTSEPDQGSTAQAVARSSRIALQEIALAPWLALGALVLLSIEPFLRMRGGAP